MDVPDAIPLKRNWPKWWSKFEIYETSFNGASLVIDLDTVFVDELKIKPEHNYQAIFLRNPWKDGMRSPEQLAGGFSYLPDWTRAVLWHEFKRDPEDIMRQFDGDDQPFLHSLLADKALRWQDHYIDEVVSYKSQAKGLGVTPDNKVIFFHGNPRPWQAEEPWIPSL